MSCKWFDVSTGECSLIDPTSPNYDENAQPENELAGNCLDADNTLCNNYAEEML